MNSSTRTYWIILRIYPVPNGCVVEEMCILLIMRFGTQKACIKWILNANTNTKTLPDHVLTCGKDKNYVFIL